MIRCGIAIAGLGMCFALAACRGPEPHVVERSFRTAANGEILHVEAVIENRSGGDGQVGVAAIVRDRATGAIVAREAKEIDLEGSARQTVVIDVPLGERGRGDPARLEAEVQAEYPIQ